MGHWANCFSCFQGMDGTRPPPLCWGVWCRQLRRRMRRGERKGRGEGVCGVVRLEQSSLWWHWQHQLHPPGGTSCTSRTASGGTGGASRTRLVALASPVAGAPVHPAGGTSGIGRNPLVAPAAPVVPRRPVTLPWWHWRWQLHPIPSRPRPPRPHRLSYEASRNEQAPGATRICHHRARSVVGWILGWHGVG